MRLSVALTVSLALLVAGCAFVPALLRSPSPGSASPEAPGIESVEPVSSDVPLGQVVGGWLAAPLQLGDPQIAVVSDACATAARTELGDADANLPTALVDVRGEGLATAIMADDERAIQCLARIDGAGVARVDSVERLAPSAVAPVADTEIGLTSMVGLDDRDGGRMLVLGRIGPAASQVKLALDDKTEVLASSADGWYAAWWPGQTRATVIGAVDNGSQVVRTIDASTGQVDGRLGAASWWLDPKALAPTATSATVQGLVLEEACASGKSPKGRIEPPLFDLSETAVTVVFGIRPLPGDQDCQGNAPYPVTFTLPEPLAGRTLLDGNGVPPRDASVPPVG